MSEKKDASQVFDEIITSGEGIVKSGQNILSCLEVLFTAIKDLKGIFAEPAKPAIPENAAPAALPEKKQSKVQPKKESETAEYKFEDVRGIMAGLSGQGKKAEARALLQKYGVSRLSDLDEKNYAAIAEEAKVITNG